jgi:hypothetical protein
MNIEDTIKEITYNVSSIIATGPTGPSFVENTIDQNGFLYVDIIPFIDGVLDFGETNKNILNVHTNQLFIQNNIIQSVENNINFPFGTLINGQIPANIIIKGNFSSISLLPVNANNGDSYFVNNELYIKTVENWVNIGSIIGIQGHQGPHGYLGYRGYTGYKGYTGYTGLTGPAGITGHNGSIGPAGSKFSNTGIWNITNSIMIENIQKHLYITSTGSVIIENLKFYPSINNFSNFCFDPYIGELVYSMAYGYTGFTGYSGTIGYTGYKGYTGYTGYLGSVGYTGYKGYTGYTGVTGYLGNTGYTGHVGYTGYTGYTGPKGPTGFHNTDGTFHSNYLFWDGVWSMENTTNVHLGNNSGKLQTNNSVSVGNYSAFTGQSMNSIVIGSNAGQTNMATGSIAIGYRAMENFSNTNSLLLGYNTNNSQVSNSIVINSDFNNSFTGYNKSLYINPIQFNINSSNNLSYDTSFFELISSSYQHNNLNFSNQILKSKSNVNFSKQVSLKQQNVIAKCSNLISNAQEITFGSAKPELYFACGEGTNSLAYSTNGFNWSSCNNPAFKISTIEWNGLVYVSHQEDSDFYYSYNGFDWIISPTTSIFQTCSDIVYGLSVFVAVGIGIGGTIAYSVDGISWIGSGTTIFENSGNGITCNGTVFVASGGLVPYRLAYSFNGISWIGISSSIFTFALRGCWDGEKFLICGYGSNHLAYSYDNIIWYGIGTIFGDGARDIAYNGKIYVAVGNGSSNSIAYSYNGISFTGNGTTIFGTTANSILWDGKKFIGTGGFASSTNTLGYSVNGINWIGLGKTIFSSQGLKIITNFKYQNSITFPTPLLIANNSSSLFTYSNNNAKTWNPFSKPIASTLKIAFNGYIYISIDYYLSFSYNGIDWISTEIVIFSTQCNQIIWDNSKFIAVGQDSNLYNIAYSYNGFTWNSVLTQFTFINTICYNGSYYSISGQTASNFSTFSYGITGYTGYIDRFDNVIQTSYGEFKSLSLVNDWGYSSISSTEGFSTGCTVSFKSNTLNGIFMVGLSDINTGRHYTTINFGYYWDGDTNAIKIYESEGFFTGTVVSTNPSINDVLRITHNGTHITYFINDILIRSLSYIGKLYLGCSIYNPTTTIISNLVFEPIIKPIANTFTLEKITWFNCPLLLTMVGNSIAWGKNIFVAVGSTTHTIMYSFDGIRWTGLGTTVFSTNGKSVCYKEKFVAVGEGTNSIAYSLDGINWIPVNNSLSLFTRGNSVIWNNNLFFCVGLPTTTNLMCSSQDGKNWSFITNIPLPNNELTTLFSSHLAPSYVNIPPIIFFCIYDWISVNTLYYSLDGINLTQIPSTVFQSVNDIVWNSKMYMIGSYSNVYNNALCYSYDGLTWVGLGTSIFTTCFSLTSNNNITIASGINFNNAITVYSYDGFNWFFISNDLYIALDYFNEQFVGFCYQNDLLEIRRSKDGINWIYIIGYFNSLYSFSGNTPWNCPQFMKVGEKMYVSTLLEMTLVINKDFSYNEIYPKLTWDVNVGCAYNYNFLVFIGFSKVLNEPTIVYYASGQFYDIGESYALVQRPASICWTGKMFIIMSQLSANFTISYDGVNWSNRLYNIPISLDEQIIPRKIYINSNPNNQIVNTNFEFHSTSLQKNMNISFKTQTIL